MPIIITSGEPAGVGPDLSLAMLAGDCSYPLVVVGDKKILSARAALLNLPFDYPDYDTNDSESPRAILNLSAGDDDVQIGAPSPQHAAYVLSQLRRAAQGCSQKEFVGMVTAPISKESILAGGYEFIGQTEYLAEQCGGGQSVMLLAAPSLRVALATTHLPLREVADSLTQESLLNTLTVLHETLPQHFKIHGAPSIKVCGLNPHAGEGGRMGDDEATIIAPAIQQACAIGINATGPHPADTALHAAHAEQTDCVLAMYHDQALPAIKLLAFDETINITLGLPFIRTSPDHGIAADIAGKGLVRDSSMRAALDFIAARV